MTAFKHNILAHLAFALIARQKRCLLSTAGSDCTCKLVTLTVHLRRSCSEEDLLLTVLFKWRRNCQTEGRHCGKKKTRTTKQTITICTHGRMFLLRSDLTILQSFPDRVPNQSITARAPKKLQIIFINIFSLNTNTNHSKAGIQQI